MATKKKEALAADAVKWKGHTLRIIEEKEAGYLCVMGTSGTVYFIPKDEVE